MLALVAKFLSISMLFLIALLSILGTKEFLKRDEEYFVFDRLFIPAYRLKEVSRSPQVSLKTGYPELPSPLHYSGGRLLFIDGKKSGEWAEFEIKAKSSGPHRVEIYGVKSYDFGAGFFVVNQERAIELDLWAPINRPSGALVVEPIHVASDLKVRIRMELKKPFNRIPKNYRLIIDGIRLVPIS